jgi:YfiR/HmsC-like
VSWQKSLSDFRNSMKRPLPNLKICRGRIGKVLAGLGMLICLFQSGSPAKCQAAEFTEYQLKALFLFNFAKYVEWPEQAFPGTNAPITIGIVGRDDFGDYLPGTVRDKTVGGRTFIIRHLSDKDNPQGCEILFISDSESSHVREILAKTAGLPILTVGEDKAFAENGGMIDFILKNDNVRFDVNLIPADKDGLKISSKLLAVADAVKGKADQP